MFACRQVNYDYGDRTVESVVVIRDFQAEDLNREFNCSVENERGSESRRAELQEEGEWKVTATQTGNDCTHSCHFRHAITPHADV